MRSGLVRDSKDTSRQVGFHRVTGMTSEQFFRYPICFGGVINLETGKTQLGFKPDVITLPEVFWIIENLLLDHLPERNKSGWAGILISFIKPPKIEILVPARLRKMASTNLVLFENDSHTRERFHAHSADFVGKFELRFFKHNGTAREWVNPFLFKSKLRGSVQRDEDQVQAFKSALTSILKQAEGSYAEQRAVLTKATDFTREAIAQVLAPSLNKQAGELAQDTYEDKKHLAKWINAELRRFGLAVKCPKTGFPCLLVATTGNRPSIGRFVLDYTDADGKRHHPISWATLPHLQLMPDDLTRSPYGANRLRSR